ncbi:MAG: coenzyme F420-0:L-glutamate ligase [Oscillospiraceae bacterium]|nr:coenzyme F420-0:L-glutamate ligase [Oscillospiraceae bacterium]
MERTVGTVVRGVRAPIIRQGDDLAAIVTESILNCGKSEGVAFHDKDIVAVTEAVVARAQGNYASVEDIAADVRAKFPSGVVGVVFPILSRNRFAICLKGIASGVKKVVLQLSYPSDEVGNHLIDPDMLDEKGVNPWTDTLSEKQYRELFGFQLHPFTGVDYVEYYKELITACGAEVEVIFSNHPATVLAYAGDVLACDIHTRRRTKRILKAAGAGVVLGLDDLLTSPVNGSGCNDFCGLLGSNKATETTVKLFPRDCQAFVEKVQASLFEATGKTLEVMVYGDGAFKDPVGKIWELADPVVSPAYTSGLAGTPNELKLKYLADNKFAHLHGDALKAAIAQAIREKDGDLKGSMASQGTTPRQLTDLIGSLCDLTSGSGDKGTPIVWIQGYFDNYSI